MSTTCLVCYQQRQVWVLPPCNHKEVCWKCCLKLVQGTIFSCPFCKHTPDNRSQLLFVTTQEMATKEFGTIMQANPFRSYKNSLYFYSNEQVARHIEQQTSYHCTQCGEVQQTLNLLKKHLTTEHRVQFCEVCLDNRKCMIGQQKLYTDHQLQHHLKNGELSDTGEVVLYHPNCDFCNRRFYDLDSFKIHLKMSSHLKCQICDVNCQNFKYVYYRNYEELDKHHQKTHFVCYIGDCINRKLENVFASEALLQDHKRRFHRKHRPEKMEKGTNNFMLGFNQTEEQELIQYDGIGKDLAHQFTIFDAHETVQRQQHKDDSIDLRQFYPQQARLTRNTRVDDAIHKLEELHNYYGTRMRQPDFAQVPLYKPLTMPFMNRGQCERLIRKTTYGREADALIQLIFAKRFQFKSQQQWQIQVEKKMKNCSPFYFYVVFPQIIRNSRNQNKGKAIMDQFYSSKLHSLPVNKKFIFHELNNFSQLIEYTKRYAQEQVLKRMQNKEIDFEIYAQFLKQMNINFYLQKQEQIYWVSKQKMTHLYHMVEHCKTQDLLKMNWLLKVGLTRSTYSLLRNFYYVLPKELPQRPLKQMSLQQLALLRAYLVICLQAMVDKLLFNETKQDAKPQYLCQVLEVLPSCPNLSKQNLYELKSLQNRSNQISQKSLMQRTKGIIIDERQCPSLLAPIDITKPSQKTTEEAQIRLGRGQLPSTWNQNAATIRKKMPLLKESAEEDFPSLGPNPKQKTTSWKQNGKKVEKVQEDDEEFPVFNFQDKFVTRKEPEKKEQFESLISFNKKTFNRSHWDEDLTRKKITEAQIQKKQEQQDLKKKGTNKKDRKKQKQEEKPQTFIQRQIEQEDSYLKQAIQESLRTAKQQEKRRNETYGEIVLPKKEKKIEDQPSNHKKDKKGKKKQAIEVVNNPKKQVQTKPQKETGLLFERIEEEEKAVVKKRQNFRRDMSDSSSSKEKNQAKNPKPKPTILTSKPPLFEDDDFAPLTSSSNQQSIVTKIIKEQQMQPEQKPSKKPRQWGKKRRNRVDESP